MLVILFCSIGGVFTPNTRHRTGDTLVACANNAEAQAVSAKVLACTVEHMNHGRIYGMGIEKIER